MKSPALAVKTSFFEPIMLKTMIEKLAARHRREFEHKQVQPGWHTITTSSLETQVSGLIQFSRKNRITNMPFVTSFLFTCIKRKEEEHMLTWACSLS